MMVAAIRETIMRRVAILLIIVFGGFAIGDCNSAEAAPEKFASRKLGPSRIA